MSTILFNPKLKTEYQHKTHFMNGVRSFVEKYFFFMVSFQSLVIYLLLTNVSKIPQMKFCSTILSEMSSSVQTKRENAHMSHI